VQQPSKQAPRIQMSHDTPQPGPINDVLLTRFIIRHCLYEQVLQVGSTPVNYPELQPHPSSTYDQSRDPWLESGEVMRTRGKRPHMRSNAPHPGRLTFGKRIG